MRCTCGEAERFTASQPFLLSAPVRPHGQTYHFETVASRRWPWWRFTAGPGDRVTRLFAHLPASSVRINTLRVLLRTRRDRGCSAASLVCILPVTLSGVSAEVFRLAQLTVWLWWPTIALPIGTSRLLAADGMAITTTVDCTVLP